MYLVKDRRFGLDYFVFTQTDPRKEGYLGAVSENVSLEYDMNAIHLWSDGTSFPEPQLGRDPTNPTHYKVFKFPADRQAAGFLLVSPNTPLVEYSWLSYKRRFPKLAEVAGALAPDEWFAELDEIDDATRLRQKGAEPEPQPGSDRDQIAEWVAKRHLGADGSIRQVVYLPTGAPPDEIRLLEVNERLARSEDVPEPLDFGIEVAGRAIKVFVADVTKAQLEKLKANPSSLPKGWEWNGSRTWGLRA